MENRYLVPLLTAIGMGLGAWCLRLRHDLQAALRDPTYGILTRAGGEEAWKRQGRHYADYEVVFLDLDHLHQLNAQWGYVEVDRHIRSALDHREGDIVMARWYSGDEIVAVVQRGDGVGYARRLLGNLRAQHLSATFGVVPATLLLADAVHRAMRLVSQAKAEGRHGTISSGELAPATGCLRRRQLLRPGAALAAVREVQPWGR